MRENTTNLGLVKPDKTDQYNVSDFNDNMQKIDDFAGLTPPKALTADKLTVARNINGVAFDGTKNVITGIGLHSMTETYSSTNVVYGFDESNQLSLFRSKKDGNIGNNPILDDGTNWEKVLESLYDKITNCILEAPNGVAEWSGVTPTGTLVNNQGVVSGFSESNYGLIDKTPPSNITSYEFMATFTTGAQQDVQQGIFANSYTNRATAQMVVGNDNNLYIQHPENASTWISVVTTTPLVANTTYQAKGIWDGSNLSLYYKTNEENEFTFVGTTPVSTIYWVEPIVVGCDRLGAFPFSGSIDLSQSYIKINGEMWWQGNDLGFNQFRVKEGLKTLIPNGRNEDGTLRNIEFTVDSDFIYTQSSQNTCFYLLLIKEETTKKVHIAVKTRFMQGLSYQMPVTVETIYPYYYYATDENFYYYTTGSTTADWKPLYASVIGEGGSINENIISFTPYQPVNLAKEQDIDGMWTGSFYEVFTGVSYTAGQSRTYSLSDYLPNDGNIYEVIFSGKVTTGATSGDTGYMQLETSVIPQATSFVACQTPTNRSMFVVGTTIAPVGADRNITISNASAADTATFQLRLSGYRKAR